jgi:HEPN domain-containing protein
MDQLTRQSFQSLAKTRLDEAKLLLNHGMYAGAYYLAGYAVECALKACVANLFKVEEFPSRRFSKECYIHALDDLVRLARVEQDHVAELNASPEFSANWAIIKDWTEESRYHETRTEKEARELFDAISDSTHGVMQWIGRYW